MNIFGVIVAGRLVKTDFTTYKEGEYVTELDDIANINHIVVFLTGLQPLPQGFGASIFISWPSTEKGIGSAEWNNLGFISNEKPSAIFRVGQQTWKKDGFVWPMFISFVFNVEFGGRVHFLLLIKHINPLRTQTFFAGAQSEGTKNAFIGIMLEPLNQIQNKLQISDQFSTENGQVAVINEFAQKMLRNFVNFVQSFAVSLPKHDQTITSTTTEMAEYVPAKSVTDWFNNFQRKLQMNPNFWRTLPS